MKRWLILWILISSQSAFAGELHCSTDNKIHGWNLQNTYERLFLYSYVTNDGLLFSPYLSGAYFASRSVAYRLDPSYTSGRRSYVGFEAYEPLEDTWFWFYPFLPKNFQHRKNRFAAYIQIIDEIGLVETVGLKCRIYSSTQYIQI